MEDNQLGAGLRQSSMQSWSAADKAAEPLDAHFDARLKFYKFPTKLFELALLRGGEPTREARQLSEDAFKEVVLNDYTTWSTACALMMTVGFGGVFIGPGDFGAEDDDWIQWFVLQTYITSMLLSSCLAFCGVLDFSSLYNFYNMVPASMMNEARIFNNGKIEAFKLSASSAEPRVEGVEYDILLNPFSVANCTRRTGGNGFLFKLILHKYLGLGYGPQVFFQSVRALCVGCICGIYLKYGPSFCVVPSLICSVLYLHAWSWNKEVHWGENGLKSFAKQQVRKSHGYAAAEVDDGEGEVNAGTQLSLGRCIVNTLSIGGAFIAWIHFVPSQLQVCVVVIAATYAFIEFTWTALKVSDDQTGEALIGATFHPSRLLLPRWRMGHTTFDQFLANVLYLPLLLTLSEQILTSLRGAIPIALEENIGARTLLMVIAALLGPLQIWLLEVVEDFVLKVIFGHNTAWSYVGERTAWCGGAIKLNMWPLWMMLGVVLEVSYAPLLVPLVEDFEMAVVASRVALFAVWGLVGVLELCGDGRPAYRVGVDGARRFGSRTSRSYFTTYS